MATKLGYIDYKLFFFVDPTVRDNSAEAIGTMWKVVGEKAISPFLSEVDNIKIAKVYPPTNYFSFCFATFVIITNRTYRISQIKEASEKAVILVKPKAVKKVAEPPQPAPKPAAERPRAGSVNPKPVKRPVNKTATFVKKSSSNTNLSKSIDFLYE